MGWYIELVCFKPDDITSTNLYHDFFNNEIDINECILLSNNYYVSTHRIHKKLNMEFIKLLIGNNFINKSITPDINQFEINLSEEEMFYASLYQEWSDYKKLGIIYEY